MQKKVILLLVSTVTFAIVKSMGNPNGSVGEEELYKCWNGCMCLLGKEVRDKIVKCIRTYFTGKDLEEVFHHLKDWGYTNIFDFENDVPGFTEDYCVKKEEEKGAGWKEDIFNTTVHWHIPIVTDACQDTDSPKCQKFTNVSTCIKQEFDKQKGLNDCGHRKN